MWPEDLSPDVGINDNDVLLGWVCYSIDQSSSVDLSVPLTSSYTILISLAL